MSEAEIRGWLIGRLPEGWFAGPPEVEIDGEEVLVIGKLAAPLPADVPPAWLRPGQP